MAAGVELGWMNQVDMEGREPKPKRAVDVWASRMDRLGRLGRNVPNLVGGGSVVDWGTSKARKPTLMTQPNDEETQVYIHGERHDGIRGVYVLSLSCTWRFVSAASPANCRYLSLDSLDLDD